MRHNYVWSIGSTELSQLIQGNRGMISLFFRTILLVALISTGLYSMASAQEGTKSIDLTFESPVLVRKGSVEITLADFVAYMNRRVPVEDQRELISSASRIEGILDNIALTEAFWLRAQEQDMAEDPFFRARLYQAAAREARDVYRQALQEEIELDSYESQAREMFLLEPERFSRAKTVDMEHILVAVDDETNEIEAMKRIIEVHEQLTNGADFLSVAESYSDDPTFPDNQGLLEDLQVGSLVPSVASAVDSLDLNEYSVPIQSRFGWHVIRVTEIQDAGQMTWEEAKPIAERRARNKHLTDSFERVLREINSAPMQFADGAVRTILEHYGAEGFGIPRPSGDEAEPDSTDQ